MRYIFSFLILFIGVQTFAAASNQLEVPVSMLPAHPFSVHDMLAMDRISDLQVSPDGKWIVFVLRKTDLETNRGRTDLWLIGSNFDEEPHVKRGAKYIKYLAPGFTGGSCLRQLTTHPESDTNPRWEPDSNTIYFISNRSDSSQVWKIRIDGGEAQQMSATCLSRRTVNSSLLQWRSSPIATQQIQRRGLMKSNKERRPAKSMSAYLSDTGTRGKTSEIRWGGADALIYL